MENFNEASTSDNIYEIRMNEFCVQNRLNVPSTVNESAKRPKCSVSPIDSSNLVSDESYLHNSTNLSIISPFVNKVQPKCLAPTLQTSLYDSVLQENVNTTNALFNTSSPYYLNKNSAVKSMSKNLFLKNLNENHIKPIRFQSTPNKTQNSSLLIPAQSNRVNFHSILDLAKSDDLKPATVINESNEPASFNSSGYNSSVLSLNNSNAVNNSSLINFNEHLKFMSMSCNKENSKMEFLSKNKRKPRTQINRQQREILEYAYNLKGYPDSNEVEYLCNLLGFEENVIRIWFQNKRARDKQRH